MPAFAKFLKEELVEGEKRWTHSLSIVFNNQQIFKATITDHYELEHKGVITNELILSLLEKLNGVRLRPTDYPGPRKVYRWNKVPYKNKSYRLIFWFKDGTTNHLWIRNCHPQG